MAPLSELIGRLSSEMCHLADLATRLEVSIFHKVHAKPDEIDRRALQEFDLLIQSLGVLSSFMADLSSALPPEQMIDRQHVLKAIPLRSIADRLAGETSGVQATSKPDTELF